VSPRRTAPCAGGAAPRPLSGSWTGWSEGSREAAVWRASLCLGKMGSSSVRCPHVSFPSLPRSEDLTSSGHHYCHPLWLSSRCLSKNKLS
jgi:hypothetical protein